MKSRQPKFLLISLWILFFIVMINCRGPIDTGLPSTTQIVEGSFAPTGDAPLTTLPVATTILKTETVISTSVPTDEFITRLPFPSQSGKEILAQCPETQESILIVNRVDGNNGYLFSESEGAISKLDINYRPESWSPSGQKLLVTHVSDRAFGFSDYDGNNMILLPQPPNGEFVCKAAWLSEDEILVSSCTNKGFPLYDDDKTFIYNLSENKYIKIGPNVIRKVEAISPRGESWFENGGDHLYLINKDGNEKIVDSLPLSPNSVYPLEEPGIIFSPDGSRLFFIKAELKQNDFIYSIYEEQISRNNLLPENLLYSGFTGSSMLMKISPDGKYMAVVISQTDLFFLNLNTKEIDYQWSWPDPRRGPPSFIWSPDSRSLALTKSEKPGQVLAMNIQTGELTTIFSDEVFLELLEWRCIQVNQ